MHRLPSTVHSGGRSAGLATCVVATCLRLLVRVSTGFGWDPSLSLSSDTTSLGAGTARPTTRTVDLGGWAQPKGVPMFGVYSRVFRTPGFLLPFLLGVVVNLALGSVSLGLLLTVEDRTGSLTRAGFVAGAFGFGNALGIFVQGRLIDRFGQSRVLVPASVVCGACLGMAVLPGLDPSYAVPALAAMAGLSFPATISSMRVLTTSLIVEERRRTSAYALLAVSFGLATVAGPLTVSAAVLLAAPAVAVAFAAVVIGAAGVTFALTPAARAWLPAAEHPSDRGQLLSPGLVTLLVANTAMGFAAGVGAVALPAVVLARGTAALAGVGFALRAAGDVIGGLAYGAIRWSKPRSTQLAAGLGLYAAFSWAFAGAAGILVALFALLLLGSTLVAVIPIVSSALLDDVAPRRSLTTAYTAMIGCSLLAGSGGNAVAGTVAQRYGPTAAYCLAATAVTAAACWATARRHTLSAPARGD